MKSEHELMEYYIDAMGDREVFEMLTVEEQTLWKCQSKDTFSFVLFSLGERIKEFSVALTEEIDEKFNNLLDILKGGAE